MKVLLVKVSDPPKVAKVPVVGSVTVPEPAVALASIVVWPLIIPATINFPTDPIEPKVFAPVTVCVPAKVISPAPTFAQVGGSVIPLL